MKGYTITDNNINIKDSYLYPKKMFSIVFNTLRKDHPNNNVLLHRTDKSMAREWAAHNLLWDLNIYRSRTKDIDLNYPQKWYVRLGYFILGSFALLVIK